jgi:hypothetical protein
VSETFSSEISRTGSPGSILLRTLVFAMPLKSSRVVPECKLGLWFQPSRALGLSVRDGQFILWSLECILTKAEAAVVHVETQLLKKGKSRSEVFIYSIILTNSECHKSGKSRLA